MLQGAPLRRPSRSLALRPTRVMQLRRCLRHLLPKKAPCLQGARPLEENHCVQRLRDRKGAAKKSLVPKKVLACFLHQHAMTASLRQHVTTPRCSWQRRAGIPRSKPRISRELWWPP